MMAGKTVIRAGRDTISVEVDCQSGEVVLVFETGGYNFARLKSEEAKELGKALFELAPSAKFWRENP